MASHRSRLMEDIAAADLLPLILSRRTRWTRPGQQPYLGAGAQQVLKPLQAESVLVDS